MNTNTATPRVNLVKEFKSASNISERSEVVDKIIKSDSDFLNFAKDYITLYLQSLVDYLKGQDLTKFHHYFLNFSRGFLHLSNRSYKDYKQCLEDELSKITIQAADLYEYLLLYLIVKTVEPGTEIYNYGLTLVEGFLVRFYQLLASQIKDKNNPLDKHLLIKSRLLLLITYNCVIETGYYMPYFYHVAIKLCTIPCVDRDLILSVLKTVKVTLNQLFDKKCYIQPILSLIILPSLEEIESNFTSIEASKDSDSAKLTEFTEFKKYMHDLANINYPLKSLDIYNSQVFYTFNLINF